MCSSDLDAFLVTWVQADGRLATQRIGADGTRREGAIIDNGQGCRQLTPSLTFDGSEYVLAYSTCRIGIYAGAAGTYPISRVGIPIGTQPRIVSVVTGKDPKIVAATGHRFLVWLDSFGDPHSPPPNVVGATLSPQNVVEHAFFIATSDPPKSSVTAATSGETVLVAWQEPTATGPRVFYRIFNAAGDVLAGGSDDTQGLALSAATATHPSVAWDGTSYVMTWESGTDIVAARVSTTGAVLGAPVVIGTASSPVAIAAGSQVAVAYVRESRAYVRFVGELRRARAIRY